VAGKARLVLLRNTGAGLNGKPKDFPSPAHLNLYAHIFNQIAAVSADMGVAYRAAEGGVI